MALSTLVPSTLSQVPSLSYTPESMQQLRLFHHFNTNVAKTLPVPHVCLHQNPWVLDAPSICLKHTHLLSTFLGMSALHLARQEQDSSMLQVASLYLDAALSSLRVAVATLNEASVEAVALNCLTIPILVRSTRRRDLSIPYENPIVVLRLLQGARDVVQQANTITLGERYTSERTRLLLLADSPKPAISPPPIQHLLPSEETDLNKLLDGVDTHDLSAQPYTSAVHCARMAYTAVLQGKQPMAIDRLLGRATSLLSEEFIQLVQINDGRALVVLAHMFAMGKFGEAFWWNRGMAAYEVQGIAGVIAKEWAWALKWPLYIISKEEIQLYEGVEMESLII
jgi:hypothetical protein